MYNSWSNLMQEIQFLELLGGSNLQQTFSNYLICLCSFRINTDMPSDPHLEGQTRILASQPAFSC